MKKEYSSPQFKVEFLLMENSLAAESKPTSVNPAYGSGDIKTMWEVGDEINKEIEI